MKKWRNVAIAAMATGAMLTLAACGSSSKSGSGSSDKTTISMYMPGDKNKNYDEVIKSVNKEIQKKYPKIQLDMKFIGWGDYTQKYSVMVTSGDSYDLAFVQNYPTNAQKGAYADMTDYLKNGVAKKAYESVDPAYWKGLTIKDKIYAFPINANVFAQNALAFNPTFIKKYNLDVSKVNSYADATPLLEKVKKSEPNVAGFPIGKDFKVSDQALEYPVTNNYPIVVDSSGKDTKVHNLYDLPETQKNLETLHDWYKRGLLPKDAATSTTTYNLQDDTWFMRQETTGPVDYGNTALKNASNGKDIQIRPITDPYKSEAQAQVALWGISKSSKHKKEAMEVLSELNTNPKVLNTLVWGLEGKQWNFTDKKNGKIKTTKDYKPGYFMGAWMMGNNSILYTQDNITDAQIAKRDSSIKETKESAMLGFLPDTSSYKTELSNISNVYSKYGPILDTGTADPIPTIKKMDAELKTAGMDKVLAAIQKQYDAFLAAKK
jgi:putative aldouronate transport system substrate-binding protein